MKKLLNRFFIHSLLGVCIVVSSFAIAPTASATQWHNYATNMCLTINNNKNPTINDIPEQYPISGSYTLYALNTLNNFTCLNSIQFDNKLKH